MHSIALKYFTGLIVGMGEYQDKFIISQQWNGAKKSKFCWEQNNPLIEEVY